MKVKELIKQLQSLPPEDEIVITAMDDYFLCEQFVISRIRYGEAQEIIMNVYIDKYELGDN